MAADQAAGLRRRHARQSAHHIHCFFNAAVSSTLLMQALHQQGQTVLLVDMHGRLFADQPARSLFDWKQQLARGQLHTWPQPGGYGWYAPGIRLDAPHFQTALRHYDCVLFDAGPIGNDIALTPGALNTLVIEIEASTDSMMRAYRLLKTLSHAGNSPKIGLAGDAMACAHVLAACCHFLGQYFARDIYNAARKDDALAALAGRMTNEETHRMTRCK